MLYVHENNIENKINTDYNGISAELKDFLITKYRPVKKALNDIQFDDNEEKFKVATKIINDYRREVNNFARRYRVDAHSKFASSFLEEMNVYLFKDIPEIKNGVFGIYNKGIYAGLKINGNREIDFITKDVDFCIGKKSSIKIDNHPPKTIILPLIAVEVKTYLDATMLGEVNFSSKSIRNASPNSKTYVLMGYRTLKDEHLIVSKQDAALTEMFALQKNKNDFDFQHEVLFEYWKEITTAMRDIGDPDEIGEFGRLLHKKTT